MCTRDDAHSGTRAVDPLVGGIDGSVILRLSCSPFRLSTSEVSPHLIHEHHAGSCCRHQLTAAEYDRIIQLLNGNRPRRNSEFSVMWSEHCSYKVIRVHLSKKPNRKQSTPSRVRVRMLIIDIGDGYDRVQDRVHNHPSFIELFCGSCNGRYGTRDILPWARVHCGLHMDLRSGSDRWMTFEDRRPQTPFLEGAVSGIAHYGNCFGVPTAGGECVFDKSYDGNPL